MVLHCLNSEADEKEKNRLLEILKKKTTDRE